MGNVLYNGVELLDINTVWTDKTTYPYAHIYESNGLYGLVISTHPALFRTRGSYTADYLPTGAVCMQYLHTQTEWYYMSSKTISSTSGYAELNYTKGFKIIWASYDVYRSTDNEFTENDGSLYLAASKPVDPTAPAYTYDRTAFLSGMAMGLTGKGNPISSIGGGASGNMIYNGVELPELPAADGHPYIYVFSANKTAVDALAPGTGLEILYFAQYSKDMYVWDGSRFENNVVGTTVLSYGYTPGGVNGSFADWEVYEAATVPAGGYGIPTVNGCNWVWCNTDLVKPDGTVYLAASEPVPAGGTDAFTKGYKVGAALRRKRVIVETDVLIDSLPIQWNSAEVTNNTKVTFGGVPFVRISNLYALDEEDVQTHGGTLVVNIGGVTITSPLMGVTAYDTVFLAMYNVDGEDIYALSIGADNVTFNGTTFPKKGVYVPDVYTIYGEAECEFKSGIEDAHSYNGTILPGLPEWDKTAYPYAMIALTSGSATNGYIYQLCVCSNPFTMASSDLGDLPYLPNGGTFKFCGVYSGNVSEDMMNLMQNGYGYTPQFITDGWSEFSAAKSQTNPATLLMVPIWVNTDLAFPDGTVHIEASEPIPI